MSALLEHVQVHLVETIEDAVDFTNWITEPHDLIAIDTETTGAKEKLTATIRLIQFGDRQHAWAIPWARWSGLVTEALNRYRGPLVFHNAKYDVPLIEHQLGIELDRSKIHDTMLMARVINPLLSSALKPLAGRLVDPKAAYAQQLLTDSMESHGWTWATVPIEFQPYWSYAALDCILTIYVYDALRQQLAGAERAYELEVAVMWVALEMERRGVRIDRTYTTGALRAFTENVGQVRAWCESEFSVSPTSNAEIIRRLLDDKVQLTKLTKSGQSYSLEAEVLEALVHVHPLAGAVLQHRRVDKLRSAYLENFLTMCDAEGILHPGINTLKARTGRMSVVEPALQTLPRKSDNNPLAIAVRNCFIPRDGNQLVMCDFDQIEARMFAHLSKDAGLISAFDEGDFFTNMARQIYRDASIEKKDPRRQLTKNAFYAITYGAGVEKFSATAGIMIDQGQLFWSMLHQTYPGLKRFQREVNATAMERSASEGIAYVRSPLTGRRYVADDNKEYTLVNYMIQGTAAEVLKMKLLEMDAVGLGKFMILPVHDEIILDVPTDDVAEVAHLVQTTMEDRDLFAVPLTAGVDIAPRWGLKGAA